jgi:FkbM family methyltransferase
MTGIDTRYFELDQLRLEHLRSLGLPMRHFFDVGASNGSWSTIMTRLFPDATFDMFEPLVDLAPSYRIEMRSNLELFPRLRLHKFALGQQRQRLKMYLDTNNPASSTALNWRTAPAEIARADVDMITLDEAVRELDLPAPDVIKMDTQGGELDVLKGATRTLPRVKVLLLECWLWRAYAQDTPLLLEIANWLRQFDFHLWDFGDDNCHAGVPNTRDCIFLNADCEISPLKSEPRLCATPGL